MEIIEISMEDLIDQKQDNFLLIDIRDEFAFLNGSIPGSVHVRVDEIEAYIKGMESEKTPVLICRIGTVSRQLAQELREQGLRVYSLEGGYSQWLITKVRNERTEIDRTENSFCQEVELALQKKFKKPLFSKFAKAINEYEMLQEGDRVAVCISGGKDSMLMAKLFQELQRHRKFHFELVFLVMDPGYNEYNRELIEENAQKLGIPITVFDSGIFDAVFEVEKSPCYLCARMRRGHLYNKAKELGCNKIALGHHYDDVIETILMGMLYGAQVQTMMPKLHSTNFEGMELIRPMYLIREEDILKWKKYHNLFFLQCACRFTDNCSTVYQDGSTASKRLEIKHLIQTMKEHNPFVESNIFRSVENVSLNTVIAYKKDGVRHHFLEDYNKCDNSQITDQQSKEVEPGF